jgi:hypothetical protein
MEDKLKDEIDEIIELEYFKSWRWAQILYVNDNKTIYVTNLKSYQRQLIKPVLKKYGYKFKSALYDVFARKYIAKYVDVKNQTLARKQMGLNY